MVDDSSLTGPGEDPNTGFQDTVENSRIITETISDAIITIDENSRILFVNRAAVNIFGYSKEEMLGSELTMLLPEYLRQFDRTGLENYLQTGQKHTSWEAVEIPGLHKSGKELSLELSFGEFHQGGRRFFTGVARDVTTRKQDEKRLVALQKMTDVALGHLTLDELLSESLNSIREVLSVDTVAILLLETEGDELVAWAAQGLEEEVKLGVRIPVGKGFAGRIVAEGRPVIIPNVDLADLYNPLLRQKGIKSLLGVPLFVEGRAIGVIHVGKLEFAHFTADDVRLLQLAADRIALAIENARLYQVEKTARVEAEDANRAKDEFLTILSHELRTPLTPIIGWVHMMRNGILPATEFPKALAVINRNAYSLKRLINDLLDMSAILSGKLLIEAASVSLAHVLEESVETMRSYGKDSNVQLSLKISAEAAGLTIKGDRNRLTQCFCNLLHNAIKFSADGGFVEISCAADQANAVVRIVDHGEGMALEFLPYVFERFRQGDASRTRAHGGLGLGLALVKSFVSAHGGTVAATSPGAGKGSVFIVTLPREVPLQAAAEEAGSKPAPARQKVRNRVLIVEDEPDTLELLAAHFRARGFETIGCESAAAALLVAERESFDILVSDLAMPAMDGMQLITAIRQRQGFQRVPAIALTGYAAEHDVAAAIAAGFDLHLSKPVDPDELVVAVGRLLAPETSRTGSGSV